MGIKLTSGAWMSANNENVEQRNTARDAFFDRVGVRRASSIRQVYIAPAARVPRALALLEQAASPRMEGDGLGEIAQQSALVLAGLGLGVPVVGQAYESRPLSISALSPEVLTAFFDVDFLATLEKSLK